MIVILEVLNAGSMQGNKLRWWPIYHEPEHEVVGRVQLSIRYSNTPVENNHIKVLICFSCFALNESYM